MEELRRSNRRVAVVGGGLGGIASARELLRRGLDFRLFEKEGQLGGSWASIANSASRVQIERGTYCLDLGEASPAPLSNYTHRHELLAHVKAFVAEHGLSDRCVLSAEVCSVAPEDGGYAVRWRRPGPDSSVQSEGSFGAVMVLPGFLPRPREVPIQNEAEFRGLVANGVGNGITQAACMEQRVAVLGHGAFAVEHARTAVEARAASVTMICRRRNLVLPRVVSWLINGAGAGADLGVDSVLEASLPMYRLLGVGDVSASMPESVSLDAQGRRILTQKNPAISDAYFLFQAMGLLRVVVGTVAAARPHALEVQLACGGPSAAAGPGAPSTGPVPSPMCTLACDVIIKCLGWDHAPHSALDATLGLRSLHGFWVNADPRCFLFKFSSSSQGARGFNTLSFSVLLKHAHAAFFHFLAQPSALESVVAGLPVATSLAADLGTTFVGQTFLALARAVPALEAAGREIDRLKALRVQEAHPAEGFVHEIEREWAAYQAALSPLAKPLEYPYSAQDAASLRARHAGLRGADPGAPRGRLACWLLLGASPGLAAALASALGSRGPAGGLVCVGFGLEETPEGAERAPQPQLGATAARCFRSEEAAARHVAEAACVIGAVVVFRLGEVAGPFAPTRSSWPGCDGSAPAVVITSLGGALPDQASALWRRWAAVRRAHSGFSPALLDVASETGELPASAQETADLLARHLGRTIDERLQHAAARGPQLFSIRPAASRAGAAPSAAGIPDQAGLRAEVLRALRHAFDGQSGTAVAEAGSPIAEDTPFSSAGLDSLAQIDLRQALGRRLGPSVSRLLTAGALFEHPTARELSRYVHEQLSGHGEEAPATEQAPALEPGGRGADRQSGGRSSGGPAPAHASSSSSPGCGVLLPPSWRARPPRALFLHGAHADADVTARVLRATGWIGREDELLELALVDAPHGARADASLFQSLVRLGWYSSARSYRCWSLPRAELALDGEEEEEERRWAASLDVIRETWRAYGPFEGLAGVCEGAAAAALAALAGALEPRPRFLLLINGYASDRPRHGRRYGTASGVPSLHIVGDSEDARAKAFPASPAWEGSLRRVERVPGRHSIPELCGELEAAVRSFLADVASAWRRGPAGGAPPTVLYPVDITPALTVPRLRLLRPSRATKQAREREADGAAPRLAVLMLPHAGGHASQYEPLAAALGKEVSVWLCEYPGHGELGGEAPLRSMRALARAVHEELLALLAEGGALDGLPLVLFGHSMGAVLLVQLAERLLSDGRSGARLQALVASGRGPPHGADGHPRLHLLRQDGQEFAAALSVLSDTLGAAYLTRSQAVAEVASLIQADFAACFEEDPWPMPRGTPWPLPVTVLYGEGDRTLLEGAGATLGHRGEAGAGALPQALLGWQDLSSLPVRYQAFPGGHDYVLTCPASSIAEVLTSAIHSSSGALGKRLDADAVAAETSSEPTQAASLRKLRLEVVRSICRASPRTRSLFESRGLAEEDDAPEELAELTFAQLGLGSLEWLLIREMLSQALGIPVPRHLIFQGPTVVSLSRLLLPLVEGGAAAAPGRVTGCAPPEGSTAAAAEAAEAEEVPSGGGPASSPAAPPDARDVGHENPEEAVPPCISASRIGANVTLGQRVRFEGPVCIRDGAMVKDDVTLGGGCEISEFAVVGPGVQLGPCCRIGMQASLKDGVTLGAECAVAEQAVLQGPLRAGDRNQFQQFAMIGGHSSHLNATRNGHISIGSDCVFEIGSIVLAPRGDVDGPAATRQPGVTSIEDRVFVHMRAEVSHDCTLEEGADLAGELAGFCHVMRGAKVMKGVTVHQFSTIGTGAFLAMGTKVRYDVLPYCIFDERTVALDRISLQRSGVASAQADELQRLYEERFSADGAYYVQSLDDVTPTSADGPWYLPELRRFFAIRARMRDRRMLARFGAANEPLAGAERPRA